MEQPTAIIIGAGPAGLTAAYELLTRTNYRPIILEADDSMGGLSRTVRYKGNRIDIGGHRFFSKSDRVMNWWLERLPLQQRDSTDPATLTYQRQQTQVATDGAGPDPQQDEQVMLLRQRRSRIYYQRRFFDYPLSLSLDTIAKLGILETGLIGLSYLKAMLLPIRPETTLEQFLINRFGKRLYQRFFQSYTEKVWGVPCERISAQWGAQRIKGLSIRKALAHALRSLAQRNAGTADVAQKQTETSLIERFLYPKFGPGQMWEAVAQEVLRLGGEIHIHQRVQRVTLTNGRVRAVQACDPRSGQTTVYRGDCFFSTMPIKDLVASMEPAAPAPIQDIAQGLVYRDFMTVGLLVRRLKVSEQSERGQQLIRDNWIYIQEPEVQLGRLQIFNNWSPWMVADPDTVWLGLEYFCDEGDHLWTRSDAQMIELAREELARIELLDPQDVLDGTVIRVPKTYPAYFGAYDRFDELRAHLDRVDNLYLIGRNGMHRYNNQDHSMLTAMVAVDNISAGRLDKANIWAVNTEQDYHETKNAAGASTDRTPAAMPQPSTA